MTSILLRPATPAVDGLTIHGAHAGDVVLPAATCAPAALIVAVEVPVSQETSAWTQAVAAAPRAHAAAMPAFRALSSTNVQGPPPRGTPV